MAVFSPAVAGPPVAAPAAARSSTVDALRGVAMLGIVVVNAPYFAAPAGVLPTLRPIADGVTAWLIGTLATGKFFLIFSFLFGFGIAAAMERARRDGAAGRARYRRRLTALAVLGVLHATLLFFGDILLLYAVLGAVVWWAREWSDRRIAVFAAAAYAVGVATQALVMPPALWDDDVAASFAPVVPGEGYLGSFLSAAAQRVEELPLAVTVLLLFNGAAALACFLAGYLAGRRRLFPLDAAVLPVLTPYAAAALSLGGAVSGGAWLVLVGTGAEPSAIPLQVAAAAAAGLSAPLLSFAYCVLFWWVAVRWEAHPVVRALAATGRASLSAYLLHSVLLGAVFFGWGLGWFGSVGAAGCLAVSLAVFAAIVLGLSLWQRRFAHGPFEWLLRCWVELRRAPLLRRRDAGG